MGSLQIFILKQSGKCSSDTTFHHLPFTKSCSFWSLQAPPPTLKLPVKDHELEDHAGFPVIAEQPSFLHLIYWERSRLGTEPVDPLHTFGWLPSGSFSPTWRAQPCASLGSHIPGKQNVSPIALTVCRCAHSVKGFLFLKSDDSGADSKSHL